MSLLSTRIDVAAIAHNVRWLKSRLAPGVRLMCVVKADAYGHGAQEIAPVMAAHGADALGCATVDEAVALRRQGISLPIVAWIWAPQQELADAFSAEIILGVSSLAQARRLIDAAVPVTVTIKVETGMHRSGVDENQWEEVFSLLRDAPHITVLGLMSHFACADDLDHVHNKVQERNFARAVSRAREAGLECPVNHLANSAATLTRPDSHWEMVRVGLACYGLEPIPGLEHDLRPAMSWISHVTNIKHISAGEASGYGLTWAAAQSGWLATVAGGYADGLPRAFQGKLHVGIGGALYPQVGRISMDQIVVDLGDNAEGIEIGEEAVLFGTGGMSATMLADATGTINYEIVCRPTGRTHREFLKENSS
ncbi:MAG: alanine racemase [Corynebacterium sp.]|nr:alanine racemase [Corynebacterium sp.]